MPQCDENALRSRCVWSCALLFAVCLASGCAPTQQEPQPVQEASSTDAATPAVEPTDSEALLSDVRSWEGDQEEPPEQELSFLDLGTPDGAPPERELRLQNFASKFGHQNIVVVRVVGSEKLRPGVLARKLSTQPEIGSRATFATRPAATAIIAMRFTGEVQIVADLIDFGSVESIDETNRLIYVDASDEKQNTDEEDSSSP